MRALFITADGMRDWREIDTDLPRIVFEILPPLLSIRTPNESLKLVTGVRREYVRCGSGHIEYVSFSIYKEVIQQ